VESSCKRVVEDFLESGQYCGPVSSGSGFGSGDIATPEKLAQCARKIGLARPEACAEGVDCCTVRSFCAECSTCSEDEEAIGRSGVEDACSIVVNDFLEAGRYCDAVSGYEDGDLRTDEFLAECSSTTSARN
jgi:hypothetical protein